MPIFEYKCEKCGEVFEELVSGDHNKEIPCPICGWNKTEKQMSVIGGIAMGKSSSAPVPSCGGSCPGANSCASAHSGCCGAGV